MYGIPLDDSCTSVSMYEDPSSMEYSKDSIVFSGASILPPR